MYFQNSRVRKMWLDKCLKRPISDDPLTGNILNGPKQCFNLNNRLFTIFIYHSEGN